MLSSTNATLVNDFGCESGPIHSIHVGEFKLRLRDIPCDECTMFTIPNVIYALNASIIELVGPSVGETFVKKFKVAGPPNSRVEQFHEIVGKKLIKAFNHNLSIFFYMTPNSRARFGIVFL